MCELAWLNEDYVRRALLHLNAGLYPFVMFQGERRYGGQGWKNQLRAADELPPRRDGRQTADTQWLCKIILNHWDDLFGQVLGKNSYHLICAIRTTRIKIHHDVAYTPAEARFAIGDVLRLLKIINATPRVAEVERVRAAFEQQVAGSNPLPVPLPVVVFTSQVGLKPLEAAKRFLHSFFQGTSQRLAADVYAEAAKQSIKERTLRQARRALGIITRRIGARKYIWIPPQIIAA